jgi:hypothetical protein
MTFPELCYYAECEGLLEPRASRLLKVIKDIKDYPSPSIDFETYEKILEKHGFTWKELSQSEAQMIEAGIHA